MAYKISVNFSERFSYVWIGYKFFLLASLDFYTASQSKIPAFIKTAPENPVLWTGMKGASAKAEKSKPDAETNSA